MREGEGRDETPTRDLGTGLQSRPASTQPNPPPSAHALPAHSAPPCRLATQPARPRAPPHIHGVAAPAHGDVQAAGGALRVVGLPLGGRGVCRPVVAVQQQQVAAGGGEARHAWDGRLQLVDQGGAWVREGQGWRAGRDEALDPGERGTIPSPQCACQAERLGCAASSTGRPVMRTLCSAPTGKLQQRAQRPCGGAGAVHADSQARKHAALGPWRRRSEAHVWPHVDLPKGGHGEAGWEPARMHRCPGIADQFRPEERTA